jgi:hypothetical protein
MLHVGGVPTSADSCRSACVLHKDIKSIVAQAGSCMGILDAAVGFFLQQLSLAAVQPEKQLQAAAVTFSVHLQV